MTHHSSARRSRVPAPNAIPISLATIVGILVSACGGSSPSSPSGQSPPPAALGLDGRPTNTTCLAPEREAASIGIRLTRTFDNLDFTRPLGMLQAPGDSSRWFVLEKGGRIRVFQDDANTSVFLPDFVDLASITTLNTSSEGGLLGMAFHPAYETNGQVFLSWTENDPMVSVIARFEANASGDALDPGSRFDILRLNQDFGNHNGGHVAFGPDGYLYIGFGDGGSAGDPLNRAQETQNLLGAMLRVDVDGGAPYAIPPTNPFAGNPICPTDANALIADCPEIFAWGLRNPWRWSFDPATGDLWVGDVGQNSFEEIDLIELGGNYGWDCREGLSDFDSPAPSCAASTNLIDPVHDYPRSEGVSVTGGYVYRGAEVPELTGSYVFADFGSGRLWRLVGDGNGGLTDELLLETGLAVASFGEGNDGELYLVHHDGGLYRIEAGVTRPAPSQVPELLSETGCMQPGDPAQPGPGLIPYDIVASSWSDGADKSRWFAIPDGTDIDIEAGGDFSFPPGSILVQQFRLGGELVETRLLMQHPDGVWTGYSYRWNEDLGDGMLVAGGLVETIRGQDWIFPSTAECAVCHTSAANQALGAETLQLNSDFSYPQTGRTGNQLSTLAGIFVLDGLVGDPDNLESVVDPGDTTAPLTERARAYLHTNCGHCHRPGGPTPTDLDLRFSTALNQTGACDVAPQSGDLGLGVSARIISPGDSSLSVLLQRMRRRDAYGMPPLASSLIDTGGAALIESWIDSLSTCL